MWDDLSSGGSCEGASARDWCHAVDVDMSAEAEGARLLAAVEEEGLDEVSVFFAGNPEGFVLQFFSTFSTRL